MKYASNIFLVFKAIGRRFYSLRKIRTQISSSPTIVIIQLAKLGDMVCTTPMFEAVKLVFPKAKLLVVGNEINRELIAHHPHVDEYIVWTDAKSIGSFLRSRKVDCACITAPNSAGLLALYLASIQNIVAPRVINGDSPYETMFYKFLSFFSKRVEHSMDSYAPREYLRLLEPFGIVTDRTVKKLTFSKKAHNVASLILRQSQVCDDDLLIGISPVAGHKIKEWGVEKFAAVCNSLIKKEKVKICIIGSINDESRVLDMLKLIKYPEEIINTCGKLSLDSLKALISKMDLFISVDTGPIYIAEAFGVPTIDIIGPVDERVQPPRGVWHKVLVPKRQKPQLSIMNSRVFDKVEALRQAQSTTVDEVVRVARELIRQIKS